MAALFVCFSRWLFFADAATTTTIISPSTLNSCVTSKTSPQPVDVESQPSDSDYSTPTSITLTMPEARVFPENTPSPPSPHHQPLINEPLFDIFMEQLRNNKPSTPGFSGQTIFISSDTEIHFEPNPNLEKFDDLVRPSESDVEFIAVPDIISYLYSDQNFVQTNIHPTPLDELLPQFEGEVVAKLNTLTEVCTSKENLSEVCVLTNNFRSWIEVSSRELEFMCLKEAQRNFHARLSGIVEPLLQEFPPTFLLPTPKVIPPLSPN